MQSTIPTLFACLAIVAACQAESYTPKVSRPEKVGDKAEFSAKGLDQRSQKVTEGGEVLAEATIDESGTLDAVREVLAVSEGGWPINLKLTVRSLKYTADKNAAPKEILTAGKEIIAYRKGREKSFTIDGEEADDATAKALNLLVELYDESIPLDPDAIFNVREPHAVGDEWDAGLDGMINSMNADKRVRYDRKASSGRVRLERVEKVNGIECCILTASLTLVPCGMSNLPENTTFTGSTYKLAFTWAVPTDPATPYPSGRVVADLAIKANFKTPDGGTRRLETTGRVSREESFKPIRHP
jgi:hypothetical protein